MRPLTFGVLASVGPHVGFCDPKRGTAPSNARADATIEAQTDLRSASDLASALQELGHRTVLLPVDPDLDLSLRHSDVDACFLALHGRAGGTGEVQSMLAMRGIPYFGPDAGAISLAFDKIRSRQMLAYHNLPVPPAIALGRGAHTTDRALELLGWPCFVKPRRGAHGLGVALLTEEDEVATALLRAMDVDEQVVLERAVEGREIQVVLSGERVLGAAEVARTAPNAGVSAMQCPPELSRSRLHGAANLARRAVSALGLSSGVTRVDLIVSDRHNEQILEVEPLPSLAKDAAAARVARAAGLSYVEFIEELVARVPRGLARDLYPTAGRLMQ